MDKRRAFELRLTTARGATITLHTITTQADALTLAQAYLSEGRAIRVELLVGKSRRYHLLAVLDQPVSSWQSPTDPGASAAE